MNRLKLIVASAALVLSLTSLLLAQTAAPATGGRQQGAARPEGERQVTVTAIPGVVAAGARWTRAWQGTDNADGIVGTSDGALLFAQEQPNRVRKLADDDSVSVLVEDTHGTGSLSLDRQGRIFAAQRTCTDPGRQGAACDEPTAIAIIYPANARKTLATSFQGKSLGRINDLIADSHGGAYFTSGGAFYVTAAGQVSSVGENLRTNGIMLSRDEKTLYVTNAGTIAAFDVLPDGSTRNQREFAKLEAGGGGDGLAIDGEGRLYVTTAPGVQVIGADGRHLGLIPTPRGVITVAFAGPDKSTLYVVGSGSLNPDGTEYVTPQGVRNNGKTIYRLPMLAKGFVGRAK